jgi:dolichol-phosphate mannosyltransferase
MSSSRYSCATLSRNLWVTLPTYNEAENLEGLVGGLLREFEGLEDYDCTVLVVDDGSPDGTGDIADRLALEHSEVHVLHRGAKDGLGRAYRAGFEHAVAAGADLVGVMDCDGSHETTALPQLVQAAERSDLVIGSRYVPGGAIPEWPWLRRVLSRAGSTYSRLLLGVKVRDLTGGYKIIRRDVLETVGLRSLRAQGYVFNIELTYRALLAGFRVEEVPITFRERLAGHSKMSLPIAFEALWLVPSLRRSAREARRRRPEPIAVPEDTTERV